MHAAYTLYDNAMVINVNTFNFYSDLMHCRVLCMVCSCDALGVALSVQVEWLHSADVQCGVCVVWTPLVYNWISFQ